MTKFAAYTQTVVTVMSTELNSLATTNHAVATTATDNTTNLDYWGDFELNVTFGVAPTAGTTVDLYLIPSLDGTNYGTDTSTTGNAPPSPYLVGSFVLQAVTSAQRLEYTRVPLTPGLWKAALHNNATGQSFAASGNTLLMRTYSVA